MNRTALLLLGLVSFLPAETLTLHILAPHSKCWTESGVGLVENSDGIMRSMQEEKFSGWYMYSWDKENLPGSVFFYCKEDVSLSNPLGYNDFSYKGVPEPFPIKDFFDFFKDDDSNDLYFISDSASEKGRFYHSMGAFTDLVFTEDIRSIEQNNTNNLTSNLSFTADNDEMYYSILNTLGDTILSERLMTCDENEIVSSCSKKSFTIDTDKLPKGEYQLAYKMTLNGKETHQITKFISGHTMNLESFELATFHIKVNSFGPQISIFSTQPKQFSILNSIGQIVKKGRVHGSAIISMPTTGIYWVKVGSETHQVRVFN